MPSGVVTTDQRTDQRTDKRTDQRTDQRTDKQTDQQTNQRTDQRTLQTDRQTDRQTDTPTDRRKDISQSEICTKNKLTKILQSLSPKYDNLLNIKREIIQNYLVVYQNCKSKKDITTFFVQQQ